MLQLSVDVRAVCGPFARHPLTDGSHSQEKELPMISFNRLRSLTIVFCLSLPGLPAAAGVGHLEIEQGDKVVFIGGTLAERMQYFGHFETLLHSRFPEHELVVRDLGWSADEITIRLRSQDFQDQPRLVSRDDG